MSAKTFFTVTGIIFSVLSVLHILRLVSGMSIVIAGWDVPYWFSFLGAAAAGYISYNAFQLRKKKNK
jgi:hypothetical protein